MSYLLLKLRLMLSFLVLGVVFFWEYFLRSKSFIMALLLTLFLGCSYFRTVNSPPIPIEIVTTIKDRSRAEAEIYRWEQYVSSIPSRAAFEHLQALYEYIGEYAQAEAYSERAFNLDPNHSRE